MSLAYRVCRVITIDPVAFDGSQHNRNFMKINATCQHTDLLTLAQRMRRTAGGHMEFDGKEAVSGKCGDRWEFRDRRQLPQWLRQELINRGL